ncbi:MAG: CRISPR-associated endoribonuclease Cas6 [Thermoproteus sp.]
MSEPYMVRVVARAVDPIAVVGFTGTVAEAVALKHLGEGLHDARPKPFSAKPIFHNGRPVVDKAAIAPGDLVELSFGLASEEMAWRLVDGVAGKGVELFGKRLAVEEVEVRNAFLDLPTTQCFKLEFLSPTRFAVRPLYKRRRALFDFTPRPLNLFKSAVRHGRALGLVRLGAPFLKWVHTYVALTDFGCFGKCVKTVEMPNGGLARGFVGWALYRAFGKRRTADMWRAIRLMETFNVGTGRGMGLGAVKATPLDCPSRPA